jgi:glycolate oxidase iron-sulfur subunit
MGAFDSHHPPAPELINQCVHCGFCLPACPTYVLWGQEMDSPRGRIYLMKMASEGATELTPQWVQHFDSCLGCVSCMTACPSGVDYGKLIEATRAQMERRRPRAGFERLHRKLIFALFPRVERLRWLRPFLALYQRSGLQEWIRRLGLLKLFPDELQAMDTLLPRLGPEVQIPAVTPAQGTKRARAGLLLGCVQREFSPDINAATVRVLAAEGCEVVAPPEQSCCGALLVHAGEENPALDHARRMIDAFEKADVDVIITNAGGCGSNVKEYGYQLRDDPKYAQRAKQFSAKCRDIAEFLTELGPAATRHPLRVRVAYHDSCHLQHAQKVRSQPRALLSAIPGLELLELPEGPLCCGSAGIFNLVQPATANALANRKAELIAPLKPDFVATGNIGCMLQIQAALARNGQSPRVLHSIQLLDASLRDVPQPD